MARRLEIFLAFALLGCHFRVGSVPAPDGARPEARDLALATPGDFAIAPDLTAPPLDLQSPPDLLPFTGEIDIGSPEAIPKDVDLSAEGMIDWAHFGYQNVAGKDDHRMAGPDAISIAAVGASLLPWAYYTPTYHWKDGAPNKNATTTSGVYIGGQGNAITITVPAGRAPHTLRLYLTHYQSTAQLTGHLSDGSIADVSSAKVSTAGVNAYYRVTIPYHAASDGQTLTIHWTMVIDALPGTGSVDVMAATIF